MNKQTRFSVLQTSVYGVQNCDARKLRYQKLKSRTALEGTHDERKFETFDFESFLTPIEREEEEERNSMKKLDVHSVSGFCCYRISSEPKYCTPLKVYSGPDPMTEFYDHVMEESTVISKIVSHQVPMRSMTSDEHKLHEAATECVNCGGPFSDRNLKVRHHDHVSGEYLFSACQKCNLQLKPRKAGKKR